MTRTALAITLLLAADAPAQPQAAVQSANNQFNFTWQSIAAPSTSGTIGWSFTVGPTPLRVTELGVLDGGSSGLLAAHRVGLWNTAGTLVSSATVQAGTASPLTAGYRYEVVTPVTLAANATYRVGAFYPAGNDDQVATQSPQTFTSYLVYNQSVQNDFNTGGFSDPILDAGTSDAFFGPNFIFTPTPEPGTVLGVSALGLGLAGWVRRKRGTVVDA